MTPQPNATPYTLDRGILLIANPHITEEPYKQSVVLICEYTAYGSFGLILNKLPELKNFATHLETEEFDNFQQHFRIGGATKQNQMMLLHSFNGHSDQTLLIKEGIYLGGDLLFLQELVKKEPSENLLICFGYTNWVGGELEKQFLNEQWYLYPGSQELVFATPPEKLWRTILLAMGGKYSSLSIIPDDLSLN